MGRRRLAREIALQALYVADVSHTPAAEAFAVVTRRADSGTDAETVDFARELALGALAHINELDKTISEKAENWSMVRMAAVDRNVLRLAAYELTARPDTPVGVVIDEAIEIVRKYSTEEATGFINGILDSLIGKCSLGETQKNPRANPKPQKSKNKRNVSSQAT